ncbi:ATP-dependent RNA helicase FAL1 [Cucumispora dikerogammari]|nr:ATP-dependent RNA helicase FAL1 [Cucumispora dikerogammari]
MSIENCNQLIEKLKTDTLKLHSTDKTQKNWSLKITKSDNQPLNRFLSTNKTFSEMQLHSNLLNKLYIQKFETPSEVQSVVIPEIIKSNNLVIQSESGSGKTISFVTGVANKIISSIEKNSNAKNYIHAIILTQTRELVIQMENVVKDICEDLVSYSSVLTNTNNNYNNIQGNNNTQGINNNNTQGNNYNNTQGNNNNNTQGNNYNNTQGNNNSNNNNSNNNNNYNTPNNKDYSKFNILIATPGSIASIIKDLGTTYDWSFLETIIIDEADALLDLKQSGSLTLSVLMSLTTHNSTLKKKRKIQFCFFSATYTEKITNFIRKIFVKKDILTKSINQETIWMLKENIKPAEIYLYNIDIRDTKQDDEIIEEIFNKMKHLNLGSRLQTKRKFQTLVTLLDSLCIGQCIVFAGTRQTVIEISEILTTNLSSVAMLHGKMEPEIRSEMIKKFENAEYKVLVATNVLSRGLDIPQVNLIINYDLPLIYDETKKFELWKPDVETYIHRVGRSGRFGRTGFVIDFIDSDKDKMNLKILTESIKCESLDFTLDEFKKANSSFEESAEEDD